MFAGAYWCCCYSITIALPCPPIQTYCFMISCPPIHTYHDIMPNYAYIKWFPTRIHIHFMISWQPTWAYKSWYHANLRVHNDTVPTSASISLFRANLCHCVNILWYHAHLCIHITLLFKIVLYSTSTSTMLAFVKFKFKLNSLNV